MEFGKQVHLQKKTYGEAHFPFPAKPLFGAMGLV